MLGVLWHPEEDEADRLIGAFVASAARGRRTAGGPDALGASGSSARTGGRAQPVKRGATAPCAQRRNVSGRRRAAVPLAAMN